MKLTNKFVIMFFLICNSILAQDWIKTEITDFATINFPSETELTETAVESVFTSEDQYAYYIVSIRKLNAQQTSRITLKEIPNLYRGVVQGTMDAVNGTVVAMNNIIVQEKQALDLEYKIVSNSDLPTQRFKRIFYINQSIISIDFWPRTDQEKITNEKKETYFNSFTFSSNENNRTSQDKTVLKETSEEDGVAKKIGHETGYFIGRIGFLLLLIAVIVGLFLLVKRILKKKKKQNVSNTETEKITKPLTINCRECVTENNYDSKYCKRCGYELKK